jgi:hypothetical protein
MRRIMGGSVVHAPKCVSLPLPLRVATLLGLFQDAMFWPAHMHQLTVQFPYNNNSTMHK